jgi:hypothetical protein
MKREKYGLRVGRPNFLDNIVYGTEVSLLLAFPQERPAPSLTPLLSVPLYNLYLTVQRVASLLSPEMICSMHLFYPATEPAKRINLAGVRLKSYRLHRMKSLQRGFL